MNLTPTDLDPYSQIRIFSKVDDVMTRLMNHLDIKVPPFRLRRQARIIFSGDDGPLVEGIDEEGSPYDIFSNTEYDEGKQELNLQFHRNYNEPDLQIKLTSLPRERRSIDFNIYLDIDEETWLSMEIEDQKPIEIAAPRLVRGELL